MQVLSYGADDLACTRFASSSLGHLVHGVHESPCSRRSGLRERWWRTARRQIPASAEPLVNLINANPEELPAFLLPGLPRGRGVELQLGEELERLRATPAEQITADLAAVGYRDAPRIILELTNGAPKALQRLVDAAKTLFSACLADDWPDIRQRLHGDLTHRTHMMMTGGPAAVLRSLHPSMTWQDQTLRFSRSAGPLPGTTGGRGFTLMPCAFGRDSLHPLVSPHRPPILIYSALVSAPDDRDRTCDPLSALLGAGRARALRAISGGCTTTELAARLYVTAPTASVHASVLRAAGLITTERDGRCVRHMVTLLGADLLAANLPY